jgi:hypothetical protein
MSKYVTAIRFESVLLAALATVTVATFSVLFHAAQNLQVVA